MAINPVIFVHGIQGSWLKDQYPVDYDREIVWTGIPLIGKRNFDALHLHELDSEVDADPRRWVMPHQAVPLIYEGLLEEIRDEMDQPYAYMFTYDWRKDNRLAAEALAKFIDKVLRVYRTHEKKAGRSAAGRVILIGHSMGGLVIKWCAARITSSRPKIAKMITIATPFKGSLKAVEALLPGARNLFGIENKKSMRHASRTLPGSISCCRHGPEQSLTTIRRRIWMYSLNLLGKEIWFRTCEKHFLISFSIRCWLMPAHFRKWLAHRGPRN